MAKRTVRALAAALSLVALALAPASAQPGSQAPVGFTEARGLVRHDPTGMEFPESLAGLKRSASIPGSPAVVIYAPAVPSAKDPRRFAIAIGAVPSPPPIEKMRERSRGQAAGGAKLEILSEGAFDWAGRPGASTFRGSYASGNLRKQYWHAWSAGYGITVLVEWPRDDPGPVAKIEAAVASRLFGGAAPGRQ